MVTAHLVNHTHWDREWYFTTADALVLSEQLFTEVLTELGRNPQANFTLDGQVSIVDEYVEIHPEAKEKIQQFVSEGRLFIGPWYTQTDAMIPDEESIIRNLVIGMQDTKKKYGDPMKVGYLPDTFGFNAQMPTLLRQVGIDNILFWRGTNFKRQTPSVYFRWKGLNGQEIIAANFPFGYFSGQITVESKKKIQQFIDERYDKVAQFEADHGDNDDVLMPSGIDQMNIIKNISETVETLNKHSKFHTVISTYPKFVEILRQKRETLPEYSGELRLPTYARVHRTIGSVRHQIKAENALLEQKILRRIEPLIVIGKKSGISIGNGLLIKLWKKLLECQAHDTLGGSVSDTVAVDIFHRFKEANEIADGIENMIKRKIAEFLDLKANQIIIFNTDPYEIEARKTITIVAPNKQFRIKEFSDAEIEHSRYYPERSHILMMTPRGKEFTNEPGYYQLEVSGEVTLPGLGYRVLTIENTDTSLPEMQRQQRHSISKNGLTLQFIKGSVQLVKTNGDIIHDIISLVDQANGGDTYDFSPIAGDDETTLPFESAECLKAGSREQLVILGSARLPRDLKDRGSLSPEYGYLNYQLKVSFGDSNLLNVQLTVDNQVFSHRLRLCFSPEIATETALAEIQAGFIETKNEIIPEDWDKQYDEKPVNLYNFDKSVSVADNKRHFTFYSVTQKEYEYCEGQLYITLMATTGQLGKPDLAWRPGRASGDTTNQGHIMMPTPLAQEVGINEFNFAFEYEEGPVDQHQVIQRSKDWLAPSVAYQVQNLNNFINRLDNKIWETEDNPTIPNQLSLLNLPNDIDVTAIYPAYTTADATIIRLRNLSREPQKLPEELLELGQTVNALEETINAMTIPPYDLLSLKVKF